MRFAVFTFALAIRIAAIEWTGAPAVAFGDGPDYLATTRSICVAHEYPVQGNLPFFRAPGLPFFMAFVTACQPERVRLIKYALAVCDALTVLLLYLLANGNLAAAAMAALHPFFIGSVTDLRTEPLFMMLLVLAMLLLVRRKHALCGIALGLAALTRPTGLLCIPLFALGVLLMRQPRRAALLFCTALLTLAPWTVRNYVRFHELIPVNDAGGFNFWRGTHPELLATVETTDPRLFAQRSLRFETETVPQAQFLVEGRARTPAARDREWRRLAMGNMRRDPSFAARATLERMAMFWRPWLHPAEHGRAAVALSLFINLGLYILGGLGLWRFRDRRVALAAVAFMGVMWVAHAPYIPSIRLRVPLTDPLLILFAASFLRDVREHHRKGSRIGIVGARDPARDERALGHDGDTRRERDDDVRALVPPKVETRSIHRHAVALERIFGRRAEAQPDAGGAEARKLEHAAG